MSRTDDDAVDDDEGEGRGEEKKRRGRRGL